MTRNELDAEYARRMKDAEQLRDANDVNYGAIAYRWHADNLMKIRVWYESQVAGMEEHE